MAWKIKGRGRDRGGAAGKGQRFANEVVLEIIKKKEGGWENKIYDFELTLVVSLAKDSSHFATRNVETKPRGSYSSRERNKEKGNRTLFFFYFFLHPFSRLQKRKKRSFYSRVMNPQVSLEL